MTENQVYENLLKAELIELLYTRDNTINGLENTVTELKNSEVNLQNELTNCQDNQSDTDTDTTINTASGIISSVLTLPEEEIQCFPLLLRTTDQGIEAHTAMVYGAIACPSESDNTDDDTTDDQQDTTCPTTND